MKVLVTGGTGKIGTPLIPFLIGRNLDVTVLTRSPEHAKKLPAGARAVIGDLMDVPFLRSQIEKADALFLNCQGELEIFQGLNAIDLARRAKIKHVVYISGQIPDSMLGAAHCGVKYLTEKVLKDSGMPYTILRPNTFMQNDEGLRESLANGIYPHPLGPVGVNRIDTRDIAEVAAIVLSTPGHANKTYVVAGPEALTADASAAIWTSALGKTVKSPPLTMDEFEQGIIKREAPAYLAHDVRIMYEAWQRDGYLATPQEIQQLTLLLGRPPRTYLAFCTEMAAKWGLISSTKSS
jgi:uncharacterized protein YbjT (DUF2867 family)